MTMADFIEVAGVEELPPGTGTSITVAGKEVALFNVDGTIFAMEDSCLHQGSSLGNIKPGGGFSLPDYLRLTQHW